MAGIEVGRGGTLFAVDWQPTDKDPGPLPGDEEKRRHTFSEVAQRLSSNQDEADTLTPDIFQAFVEFPAALEVAPPEEVMNFFRTRPGSAVGLGRRLGLIEWKIGQRDHEVIAELMNAGLETVPHSVVGAYILSLDDVLLGFGAAGVPTVSAITRGYQEVYDGPPVRREPY